MRFAEAVPDATLELGADRVDIDTPNAPSRWVTLRACGVLKAMAESEAMPEVVAGGCVARAG